METGFEAEKSLFSHTLAYPVELNPICYYWGLKEPTILLSFLYPVKALKCRCKMSGKGMCWRPYSLSGIRYKNKRPKFQKLYLEPNWNTSLPWPFPSDRKQKQVMNCPSLNRTARLIFKCHARCLHRSGTTLFLYWVAICFSKQSCRWYFLLFVTKDCWRIFSQKYVNSFRPCMFDFGFIL